MAPLEKGPTAATVRAIKGTVSSGLSSEAYTVVDRVPHTANDPRHKVKQHEMTVLFIFPRSTQNSRKVLMTLRWKAAPLKPENKKDIKLIHNLERGGIKIQPWKHQKSYTN